MTSRRTRTILAVLGLTLIGAIVWETHTFIRWQGLKADREARRQNLEDEVRAASRRGAAIRAALSALAATIARPGVASVASTKGSSAASNGADANPTLFNMREHLRQLQVNGVTASVSLQWGLLLKRLNLPPDQAAKFLAIQNAVETQKANILASAEEAGKSQSAPDVAAQINQAYGEANREVRTLLDPADYSIYKAYSQYNGTLILANNLAGNLPVNDALTDNQVEKLTQILGNASTVDKNGWIVYGTVNWAAAMPQAQVLLTPNQYDGLQSLAAQKTAEWRLSQLAAGHAK